MTFTGFHTLLMLLACAWFITIWNSNKWTKVKQQWWHYILIQSHLVASLCSWPDQQDVPPSHTLPFPHSSLPGLWDRRWASNQVKPKTRRCTSRWCQTLPRLALPLCLKKENQLSYIWHMRRDTWHVTHDRWHVTHNFSSLALTVWDLWCFEDLEEKERWLK